MVYDTTLIQNRIKERFGTCKAFCKVANMPPSTLSRKLRSGRWTSSQIDTLIKTLSITPGEMNLYFFVVKVPKKEL